MALDDLFKFEDKPMWQAAVTGLVIANTARAKSPIWSQPSRVKAIP